MYEAFFGLKEKPFSILPDPDFLYWAPGHRRAFAMLQYGLLGTPGFTVITGEIGAGKTTLIRHLIGRLHEDIAVGFLSNVQADTGPLLEWVLMALNQDVTSTSKAALHRAFQQFLTRQHDGGRRTVLIVDEAQNLDIRSLEELRLLSNINTGKDNLLQIVLAGQPELRAKLRSPELIQFAQRVTSEFHLGVLNPQETADYIKYRLTHAGADRPIFTPEACELVYKATHGNPRLINALCDAALTYAFADGVAEVSGSLVRKVLEDRRQYGSVSALAS